MLGSFILTYLVYCTKYIVLYQDTSNMASRDEASNPTDKEQEEDPGGGWDVDDDDGEGWGNIEDTTPAMVG